MGVPGPDLTENLLDLLRERPRVDRLGEISHDPRGSGPLLILSRGVPGHAYELQFGVRAILPDPRHEVDTIHIWKSYIHNHQIGWVGRNEFVRLPTGPRPGEAKAP